MNAEVRVRRFRPGDEEGIVRLLTLVFEGWPHFDLRCSPLEHWRWKYQANPFPLPPMCAVVESGGEIVGCQHTVPFVCHVEGVRIPCGIGGDQAIHPDFRRRGLSGEVSKAFRCGFPLIYLVSVNPIHVNHYAKRGLRFPPIPVFARVRDIDRQLDAMPSDRPRLMKLGFAGAKLLNTAGNLFSRDGASSRRLAISTVTRFDERIDGFWEEVCNGYDFVLERSRRFLNWRYCDPRAGGFRVTQVEDAGEVVGYSALQINRRDAGYPVGFIADLLALPDRPDVYDALVRDAAGYCDSEGVNLISCAVGRKHPSEPALRRNGFLNSRMNLPVFFGEPFHQHRAEVTRAIQGAPPGRVHFGFGDVDTLPTGVPRHH